MSEASTPVEALESIEEADLRELIAQKECGSVSRSTKFLVGAIGLVIAFFAGSFVQQHFGTASTPSGFPGGGFPAGLAAGRFPGAGADSTTGAGAGIASAATIGTITLVDGTHVYVTTSAGTIVKVDVSPSTTITAQTTVKTKDLKAGQQVIVRGEAGTDGTVAATTITQGALTGAPATVGNGARQ